MTETQLLLRGQQFCRQSVLLPHEIVASLYHHPDIFYPMIVGEPGRIAQYWMENLDLLDALEISDHGPI
jgi:hypothetical protein